MRSQVARFGDNMREVAVTEGDKVEAQIRLGFSINGYGVGDLVERSRPCRTRRSTRLVARVRGGVRASLPPLRRGRRAPRALRDAARIEAGLRAFLDARRLTAFTDTFEDLHGLDAAARHRRQRLMADGYGFGAEGDWKTAALVRLAEGDERRAWTAACRSWRTTRTTSTPADAKVLGAHMLEVCPSIAAETPSCEIHPLSIGGKADPVRLVFTAAPGPAVVVAMLDLGGRFRMVAERGRRDRRRTRSSRSLPVARALWRAEARLRDRGGGLARRRRSAPHVLTAALGIEAIADFAEIAGIELLVIDDTTGSRLQERAALEPGVLPARRGL